MVVTLSGNWKSILTSCLRYLYCFKRVKALSKTHTVFGVMRL